MNGAKVKKVFEIIAIVAVLAVAAFLIYWFSANWKNITSGSNLYTYDELIEYGEEKKQEGVEQGEQYRVQLQEYILKFNQAEEQISSLTIQLQEEMSKNNANTELIAELQETITTLQSDKLALQNEVTRLEGLLESYEDIAVGTYEVRFYNGDELYFVKAVRKDTALTESISDPTKEGYEFLGWSIDKINPVNIENYIVSEDISFYACFKELQIVYGTQWLKIETDVDLIGDYIWTDGVNYYYSQYSKQYVLDVETKIWSEITWSGLTSFTNDFIWTDGNDYYYSVGSDQYVLDVESRTWSRMTWFGLSSFDGSNIWTNGNDYYYSNDSEQYVLDIKSHTWSEMTWSGFDTIRGAYVWTDGNEYYYSLNSDQYVLDAESHTWSKMTWNGYAPSVGFCVWTDGTNIYYSRSLAGTKAQYVLDVENHTWSEMIWYGGILPDAQRIWTDGKDIYFSNVDSYVLSRSYV